jgi:hypothetical protein
MEMRGTPICFSRLRDVDAKRQSVFDSSINKTLGAPSFVRLLHKGRETANACLDRKHLNKKL